MSTGRAWLVRTHISLDGDIRRGNTHSRIQKTFLYLPWAFSWLFLTASGL